MAIFIYLFIYLLIYRNEFVFETIIYDPGFHLTDRNVIRASV